MLFSDALVLGIPVVHDFREVWIYWSATRPTSEPADCGCALGTALIAAGAGKVKNKIWEMPRVEREILLRWPYMDRQITEVPFKIHGVHLSTVLLGSLRLFDWINALHYHAVATREQIAEWVADLERQWGYRTDLPAPGEAGDAEPIESMQSVHTEAR